MLPGPDARSAEAGLWSRDCARGREWAGWGRGPDGRTGGHSRAAQLRALIRAGVPGKRLPGLAESLKERRRETAAGREDGDARTCAHRWVPVGAPRGESRGWPEWERAGGCVVGDAARLSERGGSLSGRRLRPGDAPARVPVRAAAARLYKELLVPFAPGLRGAPAGRRPPCFWGGGDKRALDGTEVASREGGNPVEVATLARPRAPPPPGCPAPSPPGCRAPGFVTFPGNFRFCVGFPV